MLMALPGHVGCTWVPPPTHLETLPWCGFMKEGTEVGGLSFPSQDRFGGCPGLSLAQSWYFEVCPPPRSQRDFWSEPGHMAVSSGPPSQADLVLITS